MGTQPAGEVLDVLCHALGVEFGKVDKVLGSALLGQFFLAAVVDRNHSVSHASARQLNGEMA